MFDTVLVANRGEIAVPRHPRPARRSASGRWPSTPTPTPTPARARGRRRRPDRPAAAAESYLSHRRRPRRPRARPAPRPCTPGYGFLAENAAFARACADAGLVFIGPPPTAIDAMGDKIRAKQTVAAAGVPVVPGIDERRTERRRAGAGRRATIGYPVLLKPSAGGGGKGMRLVARRRRAGRRDRRRPPGGARLVRRRHAAPRAVRRPARGTSRSRSWPTRHGNVVHLGERECSPAAPPPEDHRGGAVAAARRRRRGAPDRAQAAVAAARGVGYAGAGTVEFIVSADRPDEFFFMEMNTRLQVEHPVTELVTGLDLVELAAAGRRGRAAAVRPGRRRARRARGRGPRLRRGPGARVPARPAGTVLRAARAAGDGVRVDSGLARAARSAAATTRCWRRSIAYGADRRRALRTAATRARRHGGARRRHQRRFLRALLADADVRAGELDTGLVERPTAAGELAARSRSRRRCSPRPPWTGALDRRPATRRAVADARTAGGSAARLDPLAGRRPTRSRSAAGRAPREVAHRRHGDPVHAAASRTVTG